ncbi:hypothetical protein FDH02_gp27 [Pseudomonas phage VSW-3]|uniref:Rhamnogalacturonase A/B/Epimerase-like pectate lyase domain-containing protein n=1 Tax=Pseudomonas phage VSW-3 TaxID=1852562 RepID=A0A173GD14_9CAUD|nr:hypothetical protein FDH02_gp27 [Pseudomonas phage VSW-3]ANH51103.1 hypothetical protein VSW3_27 [Pseudomonas phage VSW-3]
MSDRTYYATNIFDADGVKTAWPFSFAGVAPDDHSGTTPYLYPEDVKALELYFDVNGDAAQAVRSVQLLQPNVATIVGPPVAKGRRVKIYRQTELRFPLVDYRDKQTVSEYDLDLANRQAVFIAQETLDASLDNFGRDAQDNYDAKGKRIVNLGDGRADQDAVNVRQVLAWQTTYELNWRFLRPSRGPTLPVVRDNGEPLREGDWWMDINNGVTYNNHNGIWSPQNLDMIALGRPNGSAVIGNNAQCVLNVTELKKLSRLAQSTTAFVMGEVEVGDGGGGMYQLVATGTPDGVNIIQANDGGLWKLAKTRASNIAGITLSVDNIAALKAINKNSPADTAHVAGYYTPGDGGGGTYKRTATGTPNNGSIVQATDGGLWKLSWQGELSVKQFGAKGDGVTNDTVAIQTASNVLGPGNLKFPPGTYMASTLSIPRSQVFTGEGPTASSIKQIAGTNKDFVTSENFAALLNSGLSTFTSPLCPSWMGLRNISVDGNRAGNSAGWACRLYGAYIVLENATVMFGGAGGLHTQYTTTIGTGGNARLIDQEEGYARNLIVRDNNGDGWLNEGPHNIHIDNLIAMRNEGYGYDMPKRVAGISNGAPTYVTIIHGFQNDMSWTPAMGRLRKNIRLGTNGSYGQITVDGGSLEMEADSTLIGNLNHYFGGQGGDGVVISGSRNTISTYRGLWRGQDASVIPDSWLLHLKGDFNSIGVMHLLDNNTPVKTFGNGLLVTGHGNAIADAFIRGGKIGASIQGSRTRLSGRIQNTTVAGLQYIKNPTANTGRNKLNLQIDPVSGVYVTGDRPAPLSDKFSIQASGLGPDAATEVSFEVNDLPGTAHKPGLKTFTFPHRLLYTPRTTDVILTLRSLNPLYLDIGSWRVTSTDGANVTVQYNIRSEGFDDSYVGFIVNIAIS